MILLCETFLNQRTCKHVKLPGYEFVSDVRIHFKGRGTGIFIRSGISYKKCKDLIKFEEKLTEGTIIKITLKNGKHTVGIACIDHQILRKIYSLIISLNLSTKSNAKAQKNELILGMDHNMDLLKSLIHRPTKKFLDSMIDNGMLPTIMQPSRVTQNSATLIDNIFVSSNLHRSFDSALLLKDISDHLPILTRLKQTKVVNKEPLFFESRSLNDSKLAQIKRKLYEVDWTRLLCLDTLNKTFELFCNKI